MKELSLNVLDITKNSVKAGASLIGISLIEEGNKLTLTITDNGCGMKPEVVETVMNPFYTTRTTRKVGMGIPLLMLAAEQTGGSVTIESRHEEEHPEDHGTVVTATFFTDHIDFTPIGDIVSSIETLIMGSPDIDFTFLHDRKGQRVEMDTRQLREVLGDVPLDTYEVIQWIGQFLREQYDASQP
ncbi:MAG: ATP-binding protein [Ruminococcaceae bacterium]|nr:ATP-binding protein [Oscillospiraceae bacterium]